MCVCAYVFPTFLMEGNAKFQLEPSKISEFYQVDNAQFITKRNPLSSTLLMQLAGVIKAQTHSLFSILPSENGLVLSSFL